MSAGVPTVKSDPIRLTSSPLTPVKSTSAPAKSTTPSRTARSSPGPGSNTSSSTTAPPPATETPGKSYRIATAPSTVLSMR